MLSIPLSKLSQRNYDPTCKILFDSMALSRREVGTKEFAGVGAEILINIFIRYLMTNIKNSDMSFLTRMYVKLLINTLFFLNLEM